MAAGNIIWQYWETAGEKPKYIDGLHAIARRNSGVKIILVTPETLREYLPDIEDEIPRIADIAHKADMIRSRLVARHGGMWLDSDAVVLTDLNWLFDHLQDHEFVCFNNRCRLQRERPWVRVNCFLSRPGGAVVNEWARRQHEKLAQAKFRWPEIGAQMLNDVCLDHPGSLKILPFESICPIAAKMVGAFVERDDARAADILRDCFIVMLSNRALEMRKVPLQHLTVEAIAAGDYLLSRVMQRALDGPLPAPAQLAADFPVIEIDAMFGRIRAFRNDVITTHIAKFGAHTRVELAFLLSVVRPGDAVFDLGAHIGTYAIPLAKKIGSGGRLLAVEGRAENFALLEHNLRAASLAAEATAVNVLIAREGRYAAQTPEGNTGGTYFVSNAGASPHKTTTLDELCQTHFTPRIIKMDIEGGEAAALADTTLLTGVRPIVYAEINGKALALQGASIGEIEELFRASGYRMFRNVGERNAAHDNFVVAELPALPTNLNNFDVLAVHETDERLGDLGRSL